MAVTVTVCGFRENEINTVAVEAPPVIVTLLVKVTTLPTTLVMEVGLGTVVPVTWNWPAGDGLIEETNSPAPIPVGSLTVTVFELLVTVAVTVKSLTQGTLFTTFPV